MLSFLNDGLTVKEPAQAEGIPAAKALQPDIPAAENKNLSYDFKFLGRQHKARNLRDMLRKVIREFAKHDNKFLEKFSALPKHGRTRRFIASTLDIIETIYIRVCSKKVLIDS